MAGGERIELPPKESKSFELTVIRTPSINKAHNLLLYPLSYFLNFWLEKSDSNRWYTICVIAVCAFYLYEMYFSTPQTFGADINVVFRIDDPSVSIKPKPHGFLELPLVATE